MVSFEVGTTNCFFKIKSVLEFKFQKHILPRTTLYMLGTCPYSVTSHQFKQVSLQKRLQLLLRLIK